MDTRVSNLRAHAQLVPEGLRDWWLNYLDTHVAHFRSVFALLGSPDASGRVLEVGCVPGHISVLLADMSYDVTGVDIAPERLSALWSQFAIEVHKVDAETERLPFDDNFFATILFTEILEHLRVNPILALRETARVLSDDGRLILSVPNITPIERLRFLCGLDYQGDIIAEFAKLERYGHMGHIRLYSASEVRRLLRYVGYTKITSVRDGPLRKHWLRYLCFPFRNAFRSHVYFVAGRRGG